MRSPFRRKNFSPRRLPIYVLGLAVLLWARPTPIGLGLGGCLVGLGAALRSWGAGHLVKTDRLTTTGPYAHVRNPLYAGTLLIAVGFSMIAGGPAMGLMLLLILPWFFIHYFPRKERIESARLERRYGESYALYRAQVPALWPTGRAWRPPAERARAQRWSASRYAENNELGTLLTVVAGLCVFALRTVLPL